MEMLESKHRLGPLANEVGAPCIHGMIIHGAIKKEQIRQQTVDDCGRSLLRSQGNVSFHCKIVISGREEEIAEISFSKTNESNILRQSAQPYLGTILQRAGQTWQQQQQGRLI